VIKRDIGKKDGKQQAETPGKKPILGKLKAKETRTKSAGTGGGKPPVRFGLKMNRKTLVIAAGALALVILLAAALPPIVRGISEKQQEDDSYTVVHATPRPTPTPDPGAPPVIDLSEVAKTVPLESAMNRINEPTPWEEELLYSAGQSSGIDEMIFTKLYTYNMDTKEETEQAESQIKNKSGLPGELYEARMNDHWIAWLDTNQAGTNVIHGKDRLTGDTFTIKECALIKPQLRLYGDKLIYLVQESADEDCLYYYNFDTKDTVMLAAFTDSTYGTCPPAIYGDMVVWTAPDPDNPGESLLKWIDLADGIDDAFYDDAQPAVEMPTLPPEEDTGDGGTAGGDTVDGDTGDTADGEAADGSADTGEGEGDTSGTMGEEDDPFLNGGGLLAPDHNYGKPIDPGSFAIYPVTNGDVIAYLDSLDPASARLMITRKTGEPQMVAQGVGRVFDVGEDFVVYTQNDGIMLYFWDLDRYARLTPEGQKALLSKSCANGQTVVWYDANDPNNKGDTVYISTVETPSGKLLEY